MILEFLLTDGCSLAPLATVSKQWQAVIERHNSERINLTLWSIPNLGLIPRRNRALVKYIWLSLELDEYDCSVCGDSGVNPNPDHWDNKTTNNCIIITAIHDLLFILSTWGPQGELKLDISIHSPSDQQHWFKYLTFGPDSLSHRQTTLDQRCDPRHQTTFDQRDDPKHGWNTGKLSFAPTKLALDNVFSEIWGGPHQLFFNENQESKWWQTLPEVPAITSVLLRLQTRRRWKPSTLAHMLSRFPNIEEFHYEPWRPWQKTDQAITDIAYCSLFGSITPGLRKLVFFENFDEYYSSCFMESDQMRTPSFRTSQTIAKTSLELEHLSASFVIDANHFFNAIKPEWNWPRLNSLTLTSQLLQVHEDQEKINDMLEAAASTALKMLKLKTIEIWNGRIGSAALFRFQLKGENCAVITWKATWKFTLQPRVIKAWKTVAYTYNSNNYFLVQEFLDEAISITSHADAINYLGLSKVLRPISLQQILTAHKVRNEGMPPWFAKSQPTALHKRPGFSGKYWAKALRYYWRSKERYHRAPWRMEHPMLNVISFLRGRGVDVGSDPGEFWKRIRTSKELRQHCMALLNEGRSLISAGLPFR